VGNAVRDAIKATDSATLSFAALGAANNYFTSTSNSRIVSGMMNAGDVMVVITSSILQKRVKDGRYSGGRLSYFFLLSPFFSSRASYILFFKKKIWA